MKQLPVAAFIICGLVACNSATNSTESTTDTTATTSSASENVAYAYTPTYSGDFEIGDPKHAQAVLDFWKDYDNNTFDNHKAIFADTISIDLPSGITMTGPKDSVIGKIAAHRGGLQNAVSSVEVVVSLKPKGKDESWVSVWGPEVDTHKDGKKDSIFLNENWMFNKDGKVVYIGQLEATPPNPMKK